jgi:hypothetical protein
MTIRSTVLTALAILWLLAGIPMQAATLYDSGINSETPPVGGPPPLNGTGVGANSFSLAADGTVSSISFGILECCFLEWSGTIDYYLFANNSFEPSSTPFAQGSTSSYISSVVYDDSATNEIVELEFNLTTPVALTAGTTYWLGLGLSGDGTDPRWTPIVPFSGVSAYSGDGTFAGWSFQQGTDAFALYDTTFQTASTPEPNSAWLLLGGFVLAFLAYRRR